MRIKAVEHTHTRKALMSQLPLFLRRLPATIIHPVRQRLAVRLPLFMASESSSIGELTEGACSAAGQQLMAFHRAHDGPTGTIHKVQQYQTDAPRQTDDPQQTDALLLLVGVLIRLGPGGKGMYYYRRQAALKKSMCLLFIGAWTESQPAAIVRSFTPVFLYFRSMGVSWDTVRWETHGTTMGDPCGGPMGDPWASTINPWATHGPMLETHGLAMGDPGVTHGLAMGDPGVTHGSPDPWVSPHWPF